MQFHEKKFFYLISRIFFFLDFFKFSGPLCIITTLRVQFFSHLANLKLTLVILNYNVSKNTSTNFFNVPSLSCYLGDYRKGNSFCRFSHTMALKMIIVIKPTAANFLNQYTIRIWNACKKCIFLICQKTRYIQTVFKAFRAFL